MISNTSYKIRASKSSRDVQDSDDASYNSVDEDVDERRNNSFLRIDGKLNKSIGRSRSTEFRSTRVNERRGYRGRGSGPSTNRRSDREYSDGWNLRKYDSRNNESLGMK